MTRFRLAAPSCYRGETYKYFLERETVATVWSRLVDLFGPLERCEATKTMQIRSSAFLLRATCLGNPVTVIRRRRFKSADLVRLHAALDYAEGGAQ